MRRRKTLLLVLVISLTIYAQTWPINPQAIEVSESTDEVSSIKLLDFDNDGDLDVFFTSYGDKEFGYFENYGSNKYGDKIVCYTATYGLQEILFADLNNDSFPELLVKEKVNSLDQMLIFTLDTIGKTNLVNTIVMGIGDINYTTDFDRDGKVDFISEGRWFKNLGNFQFSDYRILNTGPVGNQNYANIDGRGGLGFLRKNPYGSIKPNEILLYSLDTTNGEFYSAVVEDSIDYYVKYFGFIDIDNDSILDIVIHSSDSIVFFKNVNNDSFIKVFTVQTPYRFSSFNGFSESLELISMDVDNDNDQDLVLAVTLSGKTTFHIVQNDSFGVFHFQNNNFTPINRTDASKNRHIAVGDIDNDSFLDLIVGYPNFDAVYEIVNPGIMDSLDWTSRQITHASIGHELIGSNGITLLGDSLPDVVFTTPTGDFEIYRNMGNLDFKYSVTLPGFGGIFTTESCDLDDNGFHDILIASSGHPGFIIYFNFGNDSFVLDKTYHWPVASSDLKFADMDSDGDLDYVVEVDNSIHLYHRDRLGDYSLVSKIALAQAPKLSSSYKLVDYDEDGDIDIFLVEGYLNSVSYVYILYNQGDNTFKREKLIVPELDIQDDFEIIDFDQDGRKDLVKTRYDNAFDFLTLYWSRNLSAGEFSNEIPLTLDSKIYTFWGMVRNYSVLDFNGDSKLDVLVNGYDYWFERDSTNAVSDSQMYNNRSTLVSQFFKDLDNDQDVDIVSFDRENSRMYVLENISDQASVEGVCFYDKNRNGIKEKGEKTLPNIKCEVSSGLKTTSGSNRQIFPILEDRFTLKLDSISSENWLLTTDSAVFNIDSSSARGLTKYLFGLYPLDTFAKASNWISTAQTICDRSSIVRVGYRNDGFTVLEGTLDVYIDSLVEKWRITQYADTIIENKYRYYFDDLYPGEVREITLRISVPGVSTLPVGDSLFFSTTLVYDKDSSPVISSFVSPVFCAYDPNDKLVSPNRKGPENYTLHDEKLTYTIRFQNTGNFPASRVEITDELDEHLDRSSIEILGSSHLAQLEVSFLDNKAFFVFDDIYLPDSGLDVLGSQGYIMFRVATMPNTQDGTVIKNKASIYFDKNPAIVTNDVINTMVSVLNFDNANTYHFYDKEIEDFNWIVYPNPAKTSIRIRVAEENINQKLSILDAQGSEVFNTEIKNGEGVLTVSDWSAGVYYLRLVGEDGTVYSTKKIIVSGSN